MQLEGRTTQEAELLASLDSPFAIQLFLDSVPYSADPFYRCPRRVLAERVAHCYDGAMFAAAALLRLGHEPLLVNMRAVRDDDHVIAPFRHGRHLGAIAQSNFAGLRFREPIYRSLRELVMSYFEGFFNVAREKTLRAYSVPLRLRAFAALDWVARDEAMEVIAARLDRLRHVPLLTPEQERALHPIDDRSYRAGLVGVNEAGLYRPED